MGRKSKSRKLEAAARSQHPQLFRHGGPEPVEAPVEARPPESGSEDGSMVRASAPRWIQWLVPVLVALVTFTAFWPALQNQFVDWDDSKNFVDNPQYRGLAGTHLRWMWTTFHMGHYAPLTWMTLGLDHVLWGMHPSPARRIRSVGHRAARCALRTFLPRDDSGVPPGVRAGGARPPIVLALCGAVRLRASLQVDGGESSDRAVDPGRLSAPTAWRVPRVVERARAPRLRGEDPVRAPGRRGIGPRGQGAISGPQHGPPGSTERAAQARCLCVRLELLPLEDDRALEPLAALSAAGRGQGHRQLSPWPALPQVSSSRWESSPGARPRSGMTRRGSGPMPLRLATTL